jgi:catalase
MLRKPVGRVSYEPNTLSADGPRETPTGFRSMAAQETGARGRVRAETFSDHYSQARQFFASQTEIEQAHMASALVFELSKVEHPHIRANVVGHLRHIDESLARRVATGLGMPALPEKPPTNVPAEDRPPSPALQIIGKMKDTLEGRAVGVLVSDGSDAAAVKALTAAITKAGASFKIIAPHIGEVVLADKSTLKVDGQLAGTPSVMFDAVALVLSAEAGAKLAGEACAVDFVRDAFGHLKAIAADAGAQPVLDKAGVAKDAGIVGADATAKFIAAAKTRQWAREPSVRTLA